MADSLVREVKDLLKVSLITEVTSIYFGGGTPSLAEPSTIEKVVDAVAANAKLDSNAEVNLEANPTSSELSKLSAFKAAGVTRLSLGIQSLIDRDLVTLNRNHTAEEARRSVEVAELLFPGHVNVDVIFGRPRQAHTSWVNELNKVLELGSNHLSLYQLTVERGTALSKAVKRGDTVLPDSDAMADMYEAAVMTLEKNGLYRYEISNFSRPGYESHHNLSYWQGSNYIGIGPGAHSRFRSLEHDGYICSVNVLEPNAWMEKTRSCGHGIGLMKKMSDYERLEEVMATCLRTSRGLTNETWRLFSSTPLQDVFSPDKYKNMLHLYRSGFLTLDESGLRASSKGLQVLDSILPECCTALESRL